MHAHLELLGHVIGPFLLLQVLSGRVRPSFVLEGIIRIVRRGGARIGSTPSFPFPDPGVATFFTGLFPDWAVLCRLLPERSRFRSEVEFSVSRSDLAAEALAAAVARCPRVVTST